MKHSNPITKYSGFILILVFLFYLQPISKAATPGSLKWRFKTVGEIYSSPTFGFNGIIYVCSAALCYHDEGNKNYLYAINTNGTLKWKFSLGRVVSSPAIGSDGTIYIGDIEGNHHSSSSYLYAINPNGTLKWKYQTLGSIASSPAIGSDGTIYIGDVKINSKSKMFISFLYSISANGKLKWMYKTKGLIFSSPSIDSNDIIYVGDVCVNKRHSSLPSYLYAINPNGKLDWKFETNNRIYSSPTISPDGTIYVGSNDHYLYAINSDSKGLAPSAWPKFRHDTRNIGSLVPFPDISSSSFYWAIPAISYIYFDNITKGYPDGTYRPNNPVKRSEMAAFLSRGLHLKTQPCTMQPFPDVSTDSWYCEYVEAIKEDDITQGNPDGTYAPNDNVTRAQMAVFIARALSLKTQECTTKPFTDVPTDAWYCKYVQAIKNDNITKGYPDGTYRPDAPVTRAEMAVYLERAFVSYNSTDDNSTNGGGGSGGGDGLE